MTSSNPEHAGFQFPSTPNSNIIEVRNIAMAVTSTQIRDFFSFCGEITQLVLNPAQSGTSQVALVEFARSGASSTALLLSHAQLGDSSIFVGLYYTELETLKASPGHDEKDDKDDETEVFQDAQESHEPLRQEDKAKISVVVELLAKGYILNDKIIEKAKDFDEKKGITDTLKTYIINAHNMGTEINEKYQVVEKGQEFAHKAADKAKGLASNIDEKYQVMDKLTMAKDEAQRKAAEIDEKYQVAHKVEAAKNTAKSYAEQAMASETGQKISGYLTDVWKRAKAINEEAKKVATEKEAEAKAQAVLDMEDTHPPKSS